jgi:transposase
MLLLTEGQMSDHIGAKILDPAFSPATTLIADKAMTATSSAPHSQPETSKPLSPPKSNRIIQHSYDKDICKTRHRIENMFGKLKDWCRIATRYDRCAHTFFTAIYIAASFIFYLNQ